MCPSQLKCQLISDMYVGRESHTHTNILEVLKTEIWNRNRVMWNLATKHSHKHAQLCLCIDNKMGLKIQAFPVAPSKNLNQLCNLKRSSPLRCISWNFINTNKRNIYSTWMYIYVFIGISKVSSIAVCVRCPYVQIIKNRTQYEFCSKANKWRRPKIKLNLKLISIWISMRCAGLPRSLSEFSVSARKLKAENCWLSA